MRVRVAIVMKVHSHNSNLGCIDGFVDGWPLG
jgi:hypothetical protein